MARTILEIQTQIIASVAADSTLSTNLTSTSVTAIWRLWTYVVASAIWLHESVWDSFRVGLLDEVANMKPHTLRWYRGKALTYQAGGTLITGEDEYDNTGLTAEDIETAQIIKYASASEGNGQVVVKVAKDVAGVITAPTVPELAGVNSYFQDIKDAGVVLVVRGVAADRIKLHIDVYYNATILAADGSRLDGGASTPVMDAIKAFIKALPFDGRFIKAHLTDALQEIRSCEARRFDDPSYSGVDIFYDTYSGFLKVYDDADVTLNYYAA
jgi:hypothetical protein